MPHDAKRYLEPKSYLYDPHVAYLFFACVHNYLFFVYKRNIYGKFTPENLTGLFHSVPNSKKFQGVVVKDIVSQFNISLCDDDLVH